MKNKTINLSEHFTLAELTKTKSGIKNVPNEAQVENLRRVCRWLEELRLRCNLNKKEKIKNKEREEPIIINSGFRSPEVNRAVAGTEGQRDVAPLCSEANGESEEGQADAGIKM